MIRLKVTRKFQTLLFSIISLSLVSGLSFFVLSQWFLVEGEFGPEKHSWQFPMLQIHGASAFIMMVVFGSMLATHVPLAWRTHRSKKSGISLISILSFQIISAYFLYYFEVEWRYLIVYAHLAIGLSIPIWVLVHLSAAKGS